ncbi:MAG TPA: hypothetical protein PLO16_11000 [Acidocella sp.]|nr:hypothetical protein [Acidocella sp.]
MKKLLFLVLFGLVFTALPSLSNAQQIIAKGSWVAELPDGTVLFPAATPDACVAEIHRREDIVKGVASAFQQKAQNDILAQREQDLQDEQTYETAADDLDHANCVQQ